MYKYHRKKKKNNNTSKIVVWLNIYLSFIGHDVLILVLFILILK